MILQLATWSLLGRFTAAAPGATEFLGDALANVERGRAPAREPSALVLLFGIAWKLALVAAFIIVTVWVLRRTMRSGGLPLVSPGGAVRVLAVTHLNARHAVYLLEIGERLLVVGGGDGLSLLAEITQPVERAAIRERLQEGGGGFGSTLSSWVARMSGGGATAGHLKEGREFLEERLEAMRRQREEKP